MKFLDLQDINHPLIEPLQVLSDKELLWLMQQHRDQGRYFTMFYCRYGQMLYTLLQHHAGKIAQVDYLFARTWRYIFQELLHLSGIPKDSTGGDRKSLQPWVLGMFASVVKDEPIPSINQIHYSLQAAPPPLWCYLDNALYRLPANTRLIMVMSQTFYWSPGRIAAYLESEGENLSPEDVNEHLDIGYGMLEEYLPQDIQEIYLKAAPVPLNSCAN